MKKLFIYLAAPHLSCGTCTLSCSMWDPWPGIKPGAPALGVWRLSHWTIREVPHPSQLWSIFNFTNFAVKKFTYQICFGILDDNSLIFLNILWVEALDFFCPRQSFHKGCLYIKQLWKNTHVLTCVVSQRANYFFFYLFVLLRPSMNWMMSVQFREDSLIYWVYRFKCWLLLQRPSSNHPDIVSNQLPGHPMAQSSST